MDRKRKVLARIVVKGMLLFLILVCIFGFAASFQYGSINKGQVFFVSLQIILSVVFVLLSQTKKQRIISTIIVLIMALLCFFVLLSSLGIY